jgi:hypothetical protein
MVELMLRECWAEAMGMFDLERERKLMIYEMNCENMRIGSLCYAA